MKKFILVPGMNHGAWWFEPLISELTALGHQAVAITPAGLEPEPVIGRSIVLDTHIDQVVRAIDDLGVDRIAGEDASIVLVGHSYGGMLITAAADRRPDAIGALVYLDAVLPEDGESVWDTVDENERKWYIDSSRRAGDVVDGLPFFDDRARPQPIGTLLQGVRLTGAWRRVRTKVFVEATDWPIPTPLATSIARAQGDEQFTVHQWATRHNVMHDGPGRVRDLLVSTL